MTPAPRDPHAPRSGRSGLRPTALAARVTGTRGVPATPAPHALRTGRDGSASATPAAPATGAPAAPATVPGTPATPATPATPGTAHPARAPRVARAGRAAAGLAALVALGLGTAACGIRPTAVPIDAGPAPSRVACGLPGATASPSRTPTPAPGTQVLRLYLVCGAQVTPVRRTVSTPPTAGPGGTGTARALLGQLQGRPDDVEADAGFSSDVPGDLAVRGPGRGDPAGTLRLSMALSDLPSFALAQIVCTFAGTAAAAPDTATPSAATPAAPSKSAAAASAAPTASPAAPGQSVLLGGPGGGRVMRFRCTEALRTVPQAAQSAGTAVR